MTTIGYTSRYLLHLDRLKLDEKERGVGIPPFMVLIGLALVLHLGIMIPAFLIERSDDFQHTKQVSLAFGDKTKKAGGFGSPTANNTALAKEGKASQSEAISSLDDYFAPPAPVARPTQATANTPVSLPAPTPNIPAFSPSTLLPSARPSLSNTHNNRGVLQRPSSNAPQGFGMGGMGAGGSGGGAGTGGEGSGTTPTRAVISKYEQLLSGWIDQHKIYPPEALQQKMEGRVVVRVRITRAGEVVRTSIHTSSGHKMLDNAVLATVKRASPVPVVPSEYPGGVHLEFLIPIRFSVQP
jgi:periplasmic protein TonB